MLVLQLAVWRVYLVFKELKSEGSGGVCGGYFRVVALMWCSCWKTVGLSPGGFVKNDKTLDTGGHENVPDNNSLHLSV